MKIDLSCPKKIFFISLVWESSRSILRKILAVSRHVSLHHGGEIIYYVKRTRWSVGHRGSSRLTRLTFPYRSRASRRRREKGRRMRDLADSSRFGSIANLLDFLEFSRTTISRKYIGKIEVKRIVTIQLLDPLDPDNAPCNRCRSGRSWQISDNLSFWPSFKRLVTGPCWSTPPCPFTPIRIACLSVTILGQWKLLSSLTMLFHIWARFVARSFFWRIFNFTMHGCMGSGIFLSFFFFNQLSLTSFNAYIMYIT